MRAAGPALAAALLAACAHRGPASRAVTAEGWAPVGPEGRAHARERALADAQRRAVESAAGVRLEARSRVSGSVALEQEVETRSRGSLESWEALEEREEDGLLRVRVRAVVSPGAAPGRGPVALRLEDPRVAAGVARALAERDVPVDRRARDRVEGVGRRRFLADTLIPGTRVARASVSLTLSGPAGERAASGEASAVDLDPELAADKAAEAAGYRAGLALADALAR